MGGMTDDNKTDITGNTKPIVPEGVRVLSNGVWQDIKTTKFIKAPDAEHAPIQSSQDARDMVNRRWELWREGEAAVRRGMGKHKGAEGKWEKAYESIAKVQTELATDKEKGRSSTEAARFIRDAAGLAPARGEADGTAGNDTGMTITLQGMQILADLASKLAQNKPK